MDRLSDNPIVQQLQLLLVGYEYNFYNRKNQARADDLLVRQKACAALGHAAQALSQLAIDYQKKKVPTASREHPYPPAEIMQELEAIKTLRDDVLAAETRIRSMAVPPDDMTWQRFRDELTVLRQLLEFDVGLITQADAVEATVRTLSVERWNAAARTDVGGLLDRLRDVARDRERFLTVPGGR